MCSGVARVVVWVETNTNAPGKEVARAADGGDSQSIHARRHPTNPAGSTKTKAVDNPCIISGEGGIVIECLCREGIAVLRTGVYKLSSLLGLFLVIEGATPRGNQVAAQYPERSNDKIRVLEEKPDKANQSGDLKHAGFSRQQSAAVA